MPTSSALSFGEGLGSGRSGAFSTIFASMQKQIASFLFQHKYCPLPGVGTLQIQHTGAVSDFSSKTIAAPGVGIRFVHIDRDPSALIDYLAATTGDSKYEVTEALDHFCDNLKKDITAQQQVALDCIGVFYVDGSGKIHFTEQALPGSFVQPVFAERVIHPNKEHHILVGDKEITNTVMTGMLAPKEEIRRDNWWIWAIVLGLVALTFILLYFKMSNNASAFGNAIKI